MSTPRTYTFSDATVVQIQSVPALWIEKIVTDESEKPLPPVVTTPVGDEANASDPDYLQKMAVWGRQRGFKVLRLLAIKGVIDQPTPAEIRELRSIFGDQTDAEFKYLWVMGKLVTDDEITEFTETLMGQTLVTEKGVRDAQERFPGDHRGDGRAEVRAAATAQQQDAATEADTNRETAGAGGAGGGALLAHAMGGLPEPAGYAAVDGRAISTEQS